MYLATLHVSLDLEPEVTQSDRERILRAIRDRIRRHYGQSITARTDDDSAILIAFFDDNFQRTRGKIQEIFERIDSTGEARIADSKSQILGWFGEKFQETRDSLSADVLLEAQNSQAPRSISPASAAHQGKTIVYNHDDDRDSSPFTPLPSRVGRKSLRIPSRK